MVKRKLNYYQLDFDFIEDYSFNELFNTITILAKTRAKIRYQRFGDKFVFIQGVNNENGLLKGKMRCVRKDLLPELMNTDTDETKGIEAKDEEGLVETTHFIIDYKKDKIFLSLEYNHSGSKITDLVNYIERIGLDKEILNSVAFKPIVKDDLYNLKERINRFSEFIIKIHKDNIPQIKKIDNKIWSTLHSAIENFQSEYASLTLKFDYKQMLETSKIQHSVFNIISHLRKDNKNKYLFNKLSLKAEDSDKDNMLGNFDLLLEKVNSEIKVQRKEKYRTLISVDMFEKMSKELNEKAFK